MKNSNLIQVTLIGLLTLQISIANAAGFECKNATTRVEKTICNSSDLSRLDEEISRSYRRALSMVERYQVLERQQEVWLQRREKCIDVACISSITKQRIKHLNGMAAHAAKETKKNSIHPSVTRDTSLCNQIEKMLNKRKSATSLSEISKFYLEASFAPPNESDYVDVDIDGDNIADVVHQSCGSGEMAECMATYSLSSGGGGEINGSAFTLIRYRANIYALFRLDDEQGYRHLNKLVKIAPNGGLDTVCGE